MFRRLWNSITSWMTPPREPGPAKTSPTPHLDRLLRAKQRLREATADRLASHVERMARVAELRAAGLGRQHAATPLTEDNAGNFWMAGYQNLLDRYRDGFAQAYPITSPQDRRFGSNWPYWVTESQLSILRAMSDLIYTVQPNATGLIEGMCGYVVGRGNQYQATAKGDVSELDPAEADLRKKMARRGQEVIDRFVRKAKYGTVEGEFFKRYLKHGEAFLRLFPRGEGAVEVRFVEPSQVFMPPGKSVNDWMYGIFTPNGDVCKPVKYWVSEVAPNPQRSDGDFLAADRIGSAAGEEVPAAQMVHAKHGVDDNVKRGMPCFTYDTYDLLNNASKIRRALGEAAVVHASITAVRQHTGPDADQVQGFIDSESEFVTDPTGATGTGIPDAGVGTQRVWPGMFLDIPEGMEFVPPPGASNSDGNMQIGQYLVRNAGARFNAPEWLGTSDASNNNYASSLVAESPFVKTCEMFQSVMSAHHTRVMEFALDAAALAGEVPDDWRSYFEVQVTPCRITPRDRTGDAAENEAYIELGIKSKETACKELNLDYDQEQANIEEERQKETERAARFGTNPIDPTGTMMAGGDAALPPYQESVEGCYTFLLETSLDKSRLYFDRTSHRWKSRTRPASAGVGRSATPAESRAATKLTGADRKHMATCLSGIVKAGGRAVRVAKAVSEAVFEEAKLWATKLSMHGITYEAALNDLDEMSNPLKATAAHGVDHVAAATGIPSASWIGLNLLPKVMGYAILKAKSVLAGKLKGAATEGESEEVLAAFRAAIQKAALRSLLGKEGHDAGESDGAFRLSAGDRRGLKAVLVDLLAGNAERRRKAARMARHLTRRRRRVKKLVEGFRPVSSSNVDSFDGGPDGLKLRFRSNPSKVYTYPGKKKAGQKSFKVAASKGKWVWQHLRKKGEPFTTSTYGGDHEQGQTRGGDGGRFGPLPGTPQGGGKGRRQGRAGRAP